MDITPRFIVICERAFTASGTNNLNLINIFTQIHARTFPFSHPQFALVVNFDIAAAGPHTLRVQVLGPDGSQISQNELPVKTNAGNWQIIANYEQFSFAAPGTYTFKLTLDDTPLGERTLQVLPVASGSRKPAVA